MLPWSDFAPAPGIDPGGGNPWDLLAFSVLFWISLVVLAILARRNLRLGRSDRAAARRLAVAIVAAGAGGSLLSRDSVAGLFDLTSGPGVLAPALQFGLFAWLAYVGLEPQVRRVWPNLLVTSTRLLAGRWRDPLVGRAVLAGIVVGVLTAAPWSQTLFALLDRPGGGPTGYFPRDPLGYLQFLGGTVRWVGISLVWPLLYLTVLLVARIVTRRAWASWALLAAAITGMSYVFSRQVTPGGVGSVVLLGNCAATAVLSVWLAWRHGALGMAVAIFSGVAAGACWTLDLSRWYAWQGPIAGAIVMALAVWGFLNVLGRQSPFPSGALDG